MFCCLALTVTAGTSETRVDFNRDIRPILSANCFSCHGPDEKARKGKLRLDTAEGARKALGTVDESELLYRIETDDGEDLMPPADTGHVLTDTQKGLLPSTHITRPMRILGKASMNTRVLRGPSKVSLS